MLLETASRTAVGAALTALLGSTDAYATLTTSADAVLATILLNTPGPWGTWDAGSGAAAGVPLAFVGTGAGTAAKMKFYDSANALVFTLSAGATGSGKEAILDNAVIAVDQTGSVVSVTLTVPAGSIA